MFLLWEWGFDSPLGHHTPLECDSASAQKELSCGQAKIAATRTASATAAMIHIHMGKLLTALRVGSAIKKDRPLAHAIWQ